MAAHLGGKSNCQMFFDKCCRCGLTWDVINMGVYGGWIATLLCRYQMCSLCIHLAASRSSYDDSSWRQTVFSQSVALMSLLCPSVCSEGWLSLVCVGDHSTIRPSHSFLPLISVSVKGSGAYKAVLLFFLWECMGHLEIDWWKISVCSKCVSGKTVCSQIGASNFYLSPAINLLCLFNSVFQAHRVQDTSSVQSSECCCADCSNYLHKVIIIKP